jgi:hypothetical protein
MIYIKIFNQVVGVFDPEPEFIQTSGNIWDHNPLVASTTMPISKEKMMAVFYSMLPKSYIGELAKLDESNISNNYSKITIEFSAVCGQYGALGHRNGKYTVKEPVVPDNFNIILGIEVDPEGYDCYGTTEIYVPWNYSPINGTDNKILIPVVKELISLYTEHLRELIQTDKDRVKQDKEKQKQQELEKLETLAKKYGKTLV